jgi:ribosomal-protein-alanine N-acetyltransferase
VAYQVSRETPCLDARDLLLSPFRAEFITERYIGWLNDPVVMRFSEQRHRVHDRHSCVEFFNSFDQSTSHFWAISTRKGDYIGTATAYRDSHNGTADMGILIGVGDLQGRGHGTAVWAAIRDWLFTTGTRKITAGTMSVNMPMLRVFAKTGMEIEGLRRSHFVWEGQLVDLVFAAAFSRRHNDL